MPRSNRLLGAVALLSALSVAGCDITPEHPVLNGNDGPSSLSPSDEAAAFASEARRAESAAERGEAVPEDENVTHD